MNAEKKLIELIGQEKFDYLKDNNDLSIILLDKKTYGIKQSELNIQFIGGPTWNKFSFCDIYYKFKDRKWTLVGANYELEIDGDEVVVDSFEEIVELIKQVNDKNNNSWFETGNYPVV